MTYYTDLYSELFSLPGTTFKAQEANEKWEKKSLELRAK